VEMTDNLDPEWIALVNARKTLIEKMNGLKEEKATADESHAQDTKDMERDLPGTTKEEGSVLSEPGTPFLRAPQEDG